MMRTCRVGYVTLPGVALLTGCCRFSGVDVATCQWRGSILWVRSGSAGPVPEVTLKVNGGAGSDIGGQLLYTHVVGAGPAPAQELHFYKFPLQITLGAAAGSFEYVVKGTT